MPPKESYLKDNYNLTPADWQKIYAHQKGLCAVCKKPFVRNPNTDHRHSDGLVRGLLDSRCNRTIRESFTIELVSAILEYLKNPPATAALGRPHYGLAGRIGTKRRRKLIRKNKRQQA